VKFYLITAAVLLSSQAFATPEPMKPCNIAVKVEFAKVNSDGQRIPLPGDRKELLVIEAYLRANTWGRDAFHTVDPVLMEVDNGTASITIPHCSSSTEVSLGMKLSKSTDPAVYPINYRIDYRPIFIIDGKEFRRGWSINLSGVHEWAYSRFLPDLMTNITVP